MNCVFLNIPPCFRKEIEKWVYAILNQQHTLKEFRRLLRGSSSKMIVCWGEAFGPYTQIHLGLRNKSLEGRKNSFFTARYPK